MALPGVEVVIRDQFINLSRTNIPIGPKIVVLGVRTTDNGTNGVADLDPYNVTDEKSVKDAFGEGSDLHRAYVELNASGAQRVTLVALPSDTVFDHDAGTIESDDFTLVDPTADLFDTAFAAVEAANPDIVVPWGRGSHPLEWESPATPGNDPEIGFHADNSSDEEVSWAKKIADKVAEINQNTHPCFAILGVKPFVGTAESMTPSQVNSHLQLTDLIDREDIVTTVDGETQKNGIYLIVVATELRTLRYPETWGYSNGAAIMAGTLAQLDSWSAPTSKTIFNIEQIRYNPTYTQQLSLIEKAVVPVALNLNRTPKWIDGLTFSPAGSDYGRITTLRIVFDAVLLVRQIAERFVGEVASLQAKNALDTAITAGLRGMQQLGALYSSDFTAVYDPETNKATIDLVLNPAFELRNIEVRVSVTL